MSGRAGAAATGRPPADGAEGDSRALVVEVVTEAGAWPPDSPEVVERAAAAALAAAGREAAGELAVLLADDARLAALNEAFRGRAGPTDVLSFPGDGDGADGTRRLGDIAIAFGRCAADAAALGRPLAFHLSHLVVHGVLHCLGYDHETDAEAEVMEALEHEALAALGWGGADPAEGARGRGGGAGP
ncbi:MAG: endoribonuclease YbeY [Rhodothalassiaceae bacterium]|nr:MAG: endoribonuclease YbeY [Rhodothalassiaceae bacterium]